MNKNMKPLSSCGLRGGNSKTIAKFDSQTLFSGHQEILIEHAGSDYRLRITRQDKLILTK